MFLLDLIWGFLPLVVKNGIKAFNWREPLPKSCLLPRGSSHPVTDSGGILLILWACSYFLHPLCMCWSLSHRPLNISILYANFLFRISMQALQSQCNLRWVIKNWIFQSWEIMNLWHSELIQQHLEDHNLLRSYSLGETNKMAIFRGNQPR